MTERTLVLTVTAVTLALAACSRSGTGGGGGAAMAPAAPVMPPGVTPQTIATGDSIFAAISCKNCHGLQGVGAANGPSLVAGPWLQSKGTYPEIVQIVTNGVPRAAIKDPKHTRQMNPRGGPANLNETQIGAVAAYVWSISRGK